MVSCLGGLFGLPPRIASDPGSRCYLFEIFCGRRRDGRRSDEQMGGGGGSSRGRRRAGGPRGHAAAACVRRWRGARPQTRRRSVAEPRAPRRRVARAALERVAVSTRCMCVACICNFHARLWPAAVGRIDVLRRPNDHRASSLHPVAVYMLERIHVDLSRALALEASQYSIKHAGRVTLRSHTSYTPYSCAPHAACCALAAQIAANDACIINVTIAEP